MKFSLARSFFRKFNVHNRIANGVLEKNFVDFFGNFSVVSDYEPYVAYSQPFGNGESINIDWCIGDDSFFLSVYEDRIFLFKNDQRTTVTINPNTIQTVDDYIKGWIE